VFEDIDGNGSQDPFAGEMGLAGWTVELYNSAGLLIASTSSDASGNYEFAQLNDGSYSVCIVPVAGYRQTTPAQDANHSCGGWGMPIAVQGQFEMWAVTNFGEMLTP